MDHVVLSWGAQAVALFVLALPVACIAWTVTHEEVLREPREWCTARSKAAHSWFTKKAFYVVTCEYCFSHYVAAAVVAATRFTLLLSGWRGYAIAWFSLVWIANVYMSLFGRLRLEIKEERLEVAEAESRTRTRTFTGASRGH